MKKILMLLGLACLLNAGLTRAQAPETVRPQDSLIAVDTVLKDGIRFIQSRDFEIYKGWTTGAAFNLSYADRPGDTTPYRLNITFVEGKFTMKAGETKLMLKLKKAKTVLELINTKNIGPNDYWSELTKDGTYYYITPSFAISEAQIQQIAADKVSKMRLIYDKGKFDREIQNNAAVLGFRAASAAIQERLAATTVVEPAMTVTPKPEEEESYGYIVDEEDETPVVEKNGTEAVEVVEAEEAAEALENEAEATDGETVTAEEAMEEAVGVETEAVEEAVETEEAAEVLENEAEATDGETVTETTEEAMEVSGSVDAEAVEEAVETEEAAETIESETEAEEPATETLVEETPETNDTTEVTETVTDNAETETETETEAEAETGSEETAVETEN